jgi:hypothetical protein
MQNDKGKYKHDINVYEHIASIDETDTNFVIFNTIKKIVIAKIAAKNVDANTNPKEVATPLPPLNFMNMEKLCPRIAKPNNKRGLIPIKLATKTAKIPLEPSKISDIVNARLPHALPKLEPPIFPEPIVRMSTPFANPIISENGIEEYKYTMIAANNIS